MNERNGCAEEKKEDQGRVDKTREGKEKLKKVTETVMGKERVRQTHTQDMEGDQIRIRIGTGRQTRGERVEV